MRPFLWIRTPCPRSHITSYPDNNLSTLNTEWTRSTERYPAVADRAHSSLPVGESGCGSWVACPGGEYCIVRSTVVIERLSAEEGFLNEVQSLAVAIDAFQVSRHKCRRYHWLSGLTEYDWTSRASRVRSDRVSVIVTNAHGNIGRRYNRRCCFSCRPCVYLFGTIRSWTVGDLEWLVQWNTGAQLATVD